MSSFGKMIKHVVHIPTRHPMTGRIQYRMETNVDRLVSQEDAEKLHRHFKRKAVEGEPTVD